MSATDWVDVVMPLIGVTCTVIVVRLLWQQIMQMTRGA